LQAFKGNLSFRDAGKNLEKTGPRAPEESAGDPDQKCKIGSKGNPRGPAKGGNRFEREDAKKGSAVPDKLIEKSWEKRKGN